MHWRADRASHGVDMVHYLYHPRGKGIPAAGLTMPAPTLILSGEAGDRTPERRCHELMNGKWANFAELLRPSERLVAALPRPSISIGRRSGIETLSSPWAGIN